MNPAEFNFQVETFFPRRILDRITEVRVESPDLVMSEAAARRRRPRLTRDGKLAILACDHPARGVTSAAGEPLLMGNRQEYLGRALRILTDPDFDGVMGPPDLLEELLIVNYLLKQAGGPSFLDDKVMIGCMQRGGVAGVAGEIDDRFTAYTAESLLQQNLDGGKLMFRFVPEDERTLQTIGYCAEAITALHRHNLYAFLEPLPQVLINGKYRGNASAALLVKLVGIAAALGESSRHTWLKIPYVPEMDQVARATTLPVLLLGGEALGDPIPVLEQFAAGMRAGANLRGVMVGRNTLYPGQEDPRALARAVCRIVHQGADSAQAVAEMPADRDQNMDALTRWL